MTQIPITQDEIKFRIPELPRGCRSLESIDALPEQGKYDMSDFRKLHAFKFF